MGHALRARLKLSSCPRVRTTMLYWMLQTPNYSGVMSESQPTNPRAHSSPSVPVLRVCPSVVRLVPGGIRPLLTARHPTAVGSPSLTPSPRLGTSHADHGDPRRIRARPSLPRMSGSETGTGVPRPMRTLASK
ncbi:hypothetical protein C2E23DRAFT_401598 [Lenzites betulinus]|nr:hypothetical protein C2E23DRAFT_401598 [Lenzites betulinus]